MERWRKKMNYYRRKSKMTVMTQKDLHLAAKRDDGIAYLMERFGFLQQEQLFETIRKVSPSNANQFIKKLESKKKRYSKRNQTNGNVASLEEENTTRQENNTQDFEERGNQESEENLMAFKPAQEAEAEQLKTSEILEKLQEEEESLSGKICQIEGQHKNLVSQRHKIVTQFEMAQKALEELRRLLGEQEKNVTSLYEGYEECAVQMEVLNQERKAYRKQLDGIRKQISDLKKVTIFVYKDGSIEIESADIPSISDEEIISEFEVLISMPEAEELTIKEIKNIAKFKLMVKACKANNCGFELVFDSARVQKFWETVVTA